MSKNSKEDESGLGFDHIYPKLIEIPLPSLYSEFDYHKYILNDFVRVAYMSIPVWTIHEVNVHASVVV